jgi:hypothetical protein
MGVEAEIFWLCYVRCMLLVVAMTSFGDAVENYTELNMEKLSIM